MVLLNELTTKGGGIVPNIKSQVKRVKTNEKSAEANKAIKSDLKTNVKKAAAALEANLDNKDAVLSDVFSTIDKAAAKGVISKNAASHKKSALAKK